MVSLSGELTARCYQSIYACVDSDGIETLYTALQTSELQAYSLQPDPITSSSLSLRKQAQNIMDAMIKKEAQNGHTVLSIFLRILAPFVSDDITKAIIEDCCLEVHIEYMWHTARESGKAQDGILIYESIEDIKKLCKLLLNCGPMKNDRQREMLLHNLCGSLASSHMAGRTRKTSEIEDAFHIVLACSNTPDDLERLSYEIHKIEQEETPPWRAFDDFICKFLRINISHARYQQLCDILEGMNIALNTSELLDMYIECAGSAAVVPEWEEGTLILSLLDELGGLRDKSALIEFVEHLIAYAKKKRLSDTQQKLEAWQDRVVRLSELSLFTLNKIKTKVQNYHIDAQARYLLITIEDAPLSQQKSFEIRAWLLSSNNRPVRNMQPYPPVESVPAEISSTENAPAGKIVTANEIKDCISEIIAYYDCYLLEDVEVELFLTKKDMFDYNFDQYSLVFKSELSNRSKTLGIEYRLVLRSYERVRDCSKLRHLKRRWDLYKQYIRGEQPVETHSLVKGPIWQYGQTPDEVARFDGTLHQSTIVCLIPRFAISSTKRKDIIESMWDRGVPVALWLREHPDRTEECLKTFFENLESELNTHGNSTFLKQLPGWVWNQRAQAVVSATHHGNHLTLIRDDPDRLPPPLTAGRLEYARKETS